ncbi:unnamed protein product [Pylaiella littoralis]
MTSTTALAFCSAAAPSYDHGVGSFGRWRSTSCWTPKSTIGRSRLTVPRSIASFNPSNDHRGSRRRRSPSLLPRAGSWVEQPFSTTAWSCVSMLGENGGYLQAKSSNSRSSKQQQQQRQQQQQQGWGPLSAVRGLLRRRKQVATVDNATSKSAAAAAAARAVASTQQLPRDKVAAHSGMLLLPPLGWFTSALSDVLQRRPVEYAAAASAAGAEPVLVAGRSMWAMGRPGFNLLQGVVRSEAALSGAVLVAVPFLLRFWARAEAGHHDTLECRNVLQTYIIAASGWTCAVLAAIAGNPVSAVTLQVVWRAAAARSLWTWSDLGRGLTNTPGWLHASVSRWRGLATIFAAAGAAARLVVLLVAATGGWTAAASALSSPTVDFLPSWLVRMASMPDEGFNRSASQLCFGIGIYAWVAYYACFFLPYRVLYDEYQSYERRTAQMLKDMTNGQEQNVMLWTKLGPPLPKHLTRRLARMPPGKERETLRLAGIFRQRSCSHTVVKASTYVKNKKGKYGVKMEPLKFGDLRYWGSDLFDRLEQQEIRDKKTGWKPPDAPGSGAFKYNRLVYAKKILREIKVELGKSDAEMQTDPRLSLSNLMRFDPEAEAGEFALVEQEVSSGIEAEGENVRKASSHEMVVTTDLTPAERAREAGLPLGVAEVAPPGALGEDIEFDADESEQQVVRSTDSVYYTSGDTAGKALEESIRSRASTTSGVASEMTPATPKKQTSDLAKKMTPATAGRSTQQEQ